VTGPQPSPAGQAADDPTGQADPLAAGQYAIAPGPAAAKRAAARAADASWRRAATQALEVGALAVRARWQPKAETIKVWGGRQWCDCVAWCAFPGVVFVYTCHGAALVAQSLPGQPLTLDGSADYPAAGDAAVPDFTDAERVAALRAAAVRLHLGGTMVCVNVEVLAWGEPLTPALAMWCWPGLVRIVEPGTYELIAQSKPGQPFDVDARA
jgi:hypothetical protein